MLPERLGPLLGTEELMAIAISVPGLVTPPASLPRVRPSAAVGQ